MQFLPALDDALREAGFEPAEDGIDRLLRVDWAEQQVKVFGHQHPCIEIEAQFGLCDPEVLDESIFDGVVVEERETLEAGEGEVAGVVGESVGNFFDAPARALYAPVYVRNAETAAGLLSDTGLNEALDMARRAALVVFSVGSLGEDATMVRLGYINSTERRSLEDMGAVGDIACRWIDAYGEPVDLPPTIHPIGTSLNDLRQIPDRLLVVGGEAKTRAILAGLRGGYATHLITDKSVAKALLAAPD